MIEIQAVQGSEAWHAARAKCFNASEAPAMMGVSNYMTRTELLRQKATGIVPEVDAATQARFDMGHEVEAKARPLVEAIIGEELYPIVATDDSGKYLASSDGATMLCNIGFEHKAFNKEIAAQVAEGNVPESHRGQLDHQFLVFGFDKIIFVCSDGTPENMVHCWYHPQPERIAALKAGWDQFEIDLAAYVPEAVKPEVTGKAPETLPALRIEVTGMVTASNLEQFKTAALSVFRGINTTLTTDQDFADAEKAVKFCKDAEDRLDAAKDHALSQTESIDALFKTIDAIKEEARTVRLKLDKLVKSEKENRKTEIVAKANAEFSAHVQSLDSRIGMRVPMGAPWFSEAIKGLKSLDSMRDKVSVALANAKIEANAIADRIDVNRKVMDQLCGIALFPDFAQVCTKATDDFAALVAMRVTQQKEADERRLAAERERIRAEEQAKAQREAEKKAQLAEHERLVAEKAAKREADAKASAEKSEADRLASEEIRKLDEQRKELAEELRKANEKSHAEALAVAIQLAEEAKTAIPVVEQKQAVADVSLTNEGNKSSRNDMKRLQFRSDLIARIDAMTAVQMANLIAYLDAQVIREKMAA